MKNAKIFDGLRDTFFSLTHIQYVEEDEEAERRRIKAPDPYRQTMKLQRQTDFLRYRRYPPNVIVLQAKGCNKNGFSISLYC